jgi:molybdenum cofactor cytidylyltransferase
VSIAAIVLAAGASKRLGRPKQLLVLNGETLVERAIRIATEAGLTPIIAATVAYPELVDRLQTDQRCTTILYRRQPTEGISHSIKLGIAQARHYCAGGAILMTCDQVAVTPEHLQALCAEPDAPCGSAYAGRVGVPAYFPASSFDALLALEGDSGARDLLRGARSIPDESLSLDIDTEEDFRKALLATGN